MLRAWVLRVKPAQAAGGLGTFERYLPIWVALCMAAGIGLGMLQPRAIAGLRGIEFGKGSQINAPIAALIWLMITPMMMKVDFSSLNFREYDAAHQDVAASRGLAFAQRVACPLARIEALLA